MVVALSSFSSEWDGGELDGGEESWRITPNINLTLSHVNHIFLLEYQKGPKALRHTQYTPGKHILLNG
jgi:hypothetical protein